MFGVKKLTCFAINPKGSDQTAFSTLISTIEPFDNHPDQKGTDTKDYKYATEQLFPARVITWKVIKNDKKPSQKKGK